MVLQANKMTSIFDGTGTIYAKAADSYNNNDKKEMLHIVNDTPLELPSPVKTSVTRTSKLAMYINETFKPLFSDWYGCQVSPDANGNFIVEFVFKAINDKDDGTRAFVPIGAAQQKSENKTLNKILEINMINQTRNRVMEITNYGLEMIYDVMANSNKKYINLNKPESARRFISELSEKAGYNGMVQNIYSTITGLDIYKVLNVVFGTKNEKGDAVVRDIKPIRPVAMVNAGGRVDYIIEIKTLSYVDYEQIMSEVGVLPMPGAISAITGSISGAK